MENKQKTNKKYETHQFATCSRLILVLDTQILKVRGRKKVFYANRNEYKAWVAILISYKISFKTRTVNRDKDVT